MGLGITLKKTGRHTIVTHAYRSTNHKAFEIFLSAVRDRVPSCLIDTCILVVCAYQTFPQVWAEALNDTVG